MTTGRAYTEKPEDLASGNHQIARDIANALGLPQFLRSFKLVVEAGELITVVSEEWPEEMGQMKYVRVKELDTLLPVLKKYRIQLVEQPEQES